MKTEIVNGYRLNVSRGSDGFYKVTKQTPYGKEKFTVARCETKSEAIRLKESLARLLAQITSPTPNYMGW